MLNWSGDYLQLGVSRSGICIVQTSGILPVRTNVLCDHPHSVTTSKVAEAVLHTGRAALADTRISGRPVSVVLDNALTRLFMVTPPSNVAQRQDCEAAAAMRFQSLYGETIAAWQVDADWNPQRSFLACAVPKSLIGALQALALEFKLCLVAVRPQFVAAWNAISSAGPVTAWLGVVQPGMLTLGAVHQHRLSAVRTSPIPHADPGSDWLTAHVQREALRLNLPMPGQLQLAGHYPANWVTTAKGRAEAPLMIVPGLDTPRKADPEISWTQGLARTGIPR